MSSIGSVGSSTSPIASVLQAKGLSQDTIKLVEDDLKEAQSETGATTGSQAVDAKAVRAALDTKIKDDVASGALSEEDAATITKALDEMDAKAAGSAPAGESGGAKGADGPKGGGGGGGGSTTKTEQSRTVTVSNGVKTTVIKYTDGTTETKTTYGVTDKDTGSSKAADSSAKDSDTAKDYLSKIEPGTLFDAYA